MFQKSNKPSQKELILAALRNGDELTGLDALRRFDSYKGFAMRICELRKAGWKIQDKFIHLRSGKYVKRYFIAKEDRNPPGVNCPAASRNETIQLF